MLSRTSKVDGKLWPSNSYNQKTVRRLTTDRLYRSVGGIIKSRYVKLRLTACYLYWWTLVLLQILLSWLLEFPDWLSGFYENVIFHAIRLHVRCHNHRSTIYYFARFLTGSFVFNFLKVSAAFLLFQSQKALQINQGLPYKQLLLTAVLAYNKSFAFLRPRYNTWTRHPVPNLR